MMDAALSRTVALERQRVLDLAAMVRALQLLDEEPPRVREAVEALADRVYTHWGGDDGDNDD